MPGKSGHGPSERLGIPLTLFLFAALFSLFSSPHQADTPEATPPARIDRTPGGSEATKQAEETAPQEDVPASVFEEPEFRTRYWELQGEIGEAFRLRRPEEALRLLDEALELSPHDSTDHYNRACALALLGNHDAAIASLSRSVDLGYRDRGHMEADTDLADLRDLPDFTAIAERITALAKDPSGPAPPDRPGLPVEGGVAPVNHENTWWSHREGLFYTRFIFPPPPANQPVVTGLAPSRLLLRRWATQGTAAGHQGDVYDNFDRGHSSLQVAQFPQLTRIVYAEEAQARNLTMGLQTRFVHDAVVIGNSSTAQVGTIDWRSQPRAAYTTLGGPARLHRQYRGNHLYIYPEHRDHDPGFNGENGGFGDVFPANTPYVLISQGSSGSDRPLLEAVASALAAFRPDVKDALKQEGDLMPTIQMLFRRSQKPVRNRSDYLRGIAHPTAFDAENLDVLRLVRMAHSLEADRLPPRIALTVEEESLSSHGGSGELFTTPQAIARVFRTHRQHHAMTISAQASSDPGDRPLTFHWRILRGDPERIAIRPLDDDASRAELEIGHHPRRPVTPGSALESSRVDIGIFADNGIHLSAPAFVSITFPENEKRVYDEKGRLLSIDYADPEVRSHYADPRLAPDRDWRDEFHYDEEGSLTGWTRHREDATEEFTPEGFLVVTRDEAGRPATVRRIAYVAESPDKAARPRLRVVVSDQVFAYRPDGPSSVPPASPGTGPRIQDSPGRQD